LQLKAFAVLSAGITASTAKLSAFSAGRSLAQANLILSLFALTGNLGGCAVLNFLVASLRPMSAINTMEISGLNRFSFGLLFKCDFAYHCLN